MSVPQIIMLIWFFMAAFSGGFMHGKPRTGRHNGFVIWALIIAEVAVLYFGGFWQGQSS